MRHSGLFAVLGISLDPLGIGKDVANAILNLALSLFGSGASALVGALLGFVTTTSDPVFAGGWWSAAGAAVFERVLAVSGSVMALAFMCSIITAVLSGDHSMLARAALRLPIAALEMALLVAVTGALISATDELASSIASGATGSLSDFAAGAMASAISGSGVVGLLAGGLIVLGALSVWAELLVRTALIYVAVMAGPLIFAASVHPSARGLKRRYVEGSLALIFSKVVVAIAFATGSAMLSGLGSSTSFSAAVGALMEALTILLVAAFAPFVLLRLLLGAETILVAEGLERRPARAALQAAGTATNASGFASMLRGVGQGAAGSTSTPGGGPDTMSGGGPTPPHPGSGPSVPGGSGPGGRPPASPSGGPRAPRGAGGASAPPAPPAASSTNGTHSAARPRPADRPGARDGASSSSRASLPAPGAASTPAVPRALREPRSGPSGSGR